MSENYLGIITENYYRELLQRIITENYDLVYNIKKLRFIGILAYPTRTKVVRNNVSQGCHKIIKSESK